MQIKEILHENKFTGVVYYFESNGFSLVSELENFDFDLLYFVPGLEEEIVVEAIGICKYALEQLQEVEVVVEEATTHEEADINTSSRDNVIQVGIVDDADEINNIFENWINVNKVDRKK